MALTDAKIRAAKPDIKPYKIPDTGNMFLLSNVSLQSCAMLPSQALSPITLPWIWLAR